MAKVDKCSSFWGILDSYSKVVWAAVGTLLLVGILCAAAHMHGGCKAKWCCKQSSQVEQQK